MSKEAAAAGPPPPEVALAINRKKLRYARYADTKNWDAFEAEVGRPDTQYDYQGVDGRTIVLSGVTLKFTSTAGFRNFFEPAFAGLQTLHLVAPGDFTATEDEDEVQAVFSFEDQLLAPPFGAWAALRGGGFYYETWRRHHFGDGGSEWFLASLRMRRNYQEMTLLMRVLFVFAGFKRMLFSRSSS